MHTAFTKTESTSTIKTAAPTKQKQIFALMLHDGRIVIGQSTNPCRRIAALNSGTNAAMPKPLMVNRILGIKEVTETRSLPSVVNQFCNDFGNDRVLCV